MTSIGTLFAFVVVCAAVLVLRVAPAGSRPPFRVPFGPVFPVLGILSCAYLMLSLPVITWVPIPGVAESRDADLLVLRPEAQFRWPTRPKTIGGRHAEAGEFRHGLRTAGAVQRRLHVTCSDS
jgi:amino acid transporter